MRADRGNAKSGKWDTTVDDDPDTSFTSSAIYDTDPQGLEARGPAAAALRQGLDRSHVRRGDHRHPVG
jgi:hypothetical protein